MKKAVHYDADDIKTILAERHHVDVKNVGEKPGCFIGENNDRSNHTVTSSATYGIIIS